MPQSARASGLRPKVGGQERAQRSRTAVTRRRARTRAAEDEAATGEGEVGMGSLEDIMEKADGGQAVPNWVPDNAYLKVRLDWAVCLLSLRTC